MTEFLVIRMSPDAAAPAHWIAVDSAGTRKGPPVAGALDEVRADLRDRRAIVLVPGADVLTTTVDLPVKAGPRLHAALPYALEESVADDVEHLHFAAGTRRADGRTPVSVVSRARMDEWLSRLHAAGIYPTRVIPENHGLARIPGTVSVLLDGDLLFLNDGDNVEVVLQGMNPGDALVAIGALDDRPLDEKTADEAAASSKRSTHLLAYCAPADDERYRHDWNALRHELDSVDVRLLNDGTLPRLAATVATGAGINLLQGRYGPKTEYSGMLAPWKNAAMVLLALIVVATAVKAANVYVLANREAALKAAFHNEYRQISPGAPEVDDPVRLVASLRARAGGGSAGTPQVLLKALEQLGRATSQANDARIDAISFRAGVVDVRLTAPSVSVLDGIRRTIDDGGSFSARIQSTDQEGERVNSRIQIQAKEP
ncbi:MAG TPA: type II secretion system protein GspL [Woeseiaceae bacterium]|nr:type II secretion system protein GspL [Woeseiaceae bacterium]